jgi:HTH-type transcriptional regulator, global nitrogen regulator NrpRI
MKYKNEKKQLAILQILREAENAIGSSKITEQLATMGFDISERTVRYYLLDMDKEGLTTNLGKKGRLITDMGLKELDSARIIEKVGFLAAKIDRMTYQMSFDLTKKSGTVVINVSIMKRSYLKTAQSMFPRVFEAGYSMGTLMALFKPGDRLGSSIVPDDMVGLGTVCSISLNGVLLAHGIPTYSRFGGLLELRNKKPTRFVEIINYEGTSLDPLEIFIRSGMTDYIGATETGNGRIGVGFREVPAESRETVIELAEKLKEVGLGGFLKIGWPSQPLLEIPVSEGRVGVIVIGGLNPAAMLEETDIHIESHALAGLAEFDTLFPYWELDDRVARI